jgi:CheY-like chemotaxis protein
LVRVAQIPLSMNEGQTILMVDDGEHDLFFLRKAFVTADCPFLLQEASNGEEAIRYLNGDDRYQDRNKFPLPIVMLLDLNMPKKNGFDVLAWVRAQPKLKPLAVIILTASMRDEDLERAFELGATSFLVKPSDLETLSAMMRCLCAWIQINHFPALASPHDRDAQKPASDSQNLKTTLP